MKNYDQVVKMAEIESEKIKKRNSLIAGIYIKKRPKTEDEQDWLQDGILKMLEADQKGREIKDGKGVEIRGKDGKPLNPEHLLNICVKQARLDSLKKRYRQTEKRLINISGKESRIEETGENWSLQEDIAHKIEIRDIREHVEKNLSSDEEKNLFYLYYTNDNTMQAIANRLQTNKMEISRKIKRLNTKIEKMKVGQLFEQRFVMPKTKTETLLFEQWQTATETMPTLKDADIDRDKASSAVITDKTMIGTPYYRKPDINLHRGSRIAWRAMDNDYYQGLQDAECPSTWQQRDYYRHVHECL